LPPELTLAEAAALFLKEAETDKGPEHRTFDFYRHNLQRLVARLGNRRLRMVSQQDGVDYKAWLKAGTRTKPTFESLHYLALPERKPGALDYARPPAGWSLPDAFCSAAAAPGEGGPERGARQYIRVLRLLETYDLAAVTAAVERALALAVADADAVRLLLERARERPAVGFDLTGRPQLLAVRVSPPDLAAYAALASRKEVRP
jgi:hypothetical protein